MLTKSQKKKAVLIALVVWGTLAVVAPVLWQGFAFALTGNWYFEGDRLGIWFSTSGFVFALLMLAQIPFI
jgi:hypothetical protein